MSCIFCGIADGLVPAHVVFEDGVSLGFLDSRPLFPGHVLLIPRAHVGTMMDLPDELAGPLFLNACSIARAMETALGAEGSFVAVNNRISQSVPHLHIHVAPRKKGDGLKGFFWPRRTYKSEEEMARVADLLRRALQ